MHGETQYIIDVIKDTFYDRKSEGTLYPPPTQSDSTLSNPAKSDNTSLANYTNCILNLLEYQ